MCFGYGCLFAWVSVCVRVFVCVRVADRLHVCFSAAAWLRVYLLACLIDCLSVCLWASSMVCAYIWWRWVLIPLGVCLFACVLL